MARKKVETITTDFLDTMLFGAWRYYIGRHTIHAHSAAKELMEFFSKNPERFTEARKTFMGIDIRRCINDQIHYQGGVITENSHHDGALDALTLLVKAISEHTNGICDQEINNTLDVRLDLADGKTEVLEFPDKSRTYHFNIMELIEDMGVWQRAAGILAPTHNITYFDPVDKVEKTKPGFAVVDLVRYDTSEPWKYAIHYMTVDGQLKNPWSDSYLAPEYIKKVEPIR